MTSVNAYGVGAYTAQYNRRRRSIHKLSTTHSVASLHRVPSMIWCCAVADRVGQYRSEDG
eukprot:3941138-Rhodomonas_salina.3